MQFIKCPCGSTLNYLACCHVYISGQAPPQTAEALMRSRFSAYTLSNIDYIKKTMQGKPLIGFNETEAERWSKSVLWLGLKVMNSYQKDEQTGFVEFMANYLDHHLIKTIHEISEFQLKNEHWYYVDGEQIPHTPTTVPRNAPCPCGSQKKFKNCHSPKGS